MTRDARSRLWLSAWVVGFAVAMACLLLAFKYRTAADGLERARLALVAAETREVVQRNLTFGIAFAHIATLPDVLLSTRNTDALIEGIDVVDPQGTALYSTDPARRGHPVEPAWREAMGRARGEAWNAREGSEAVQAAVVRNPFGLTLGHALVRYRLDELDAATVRFARYIAVVGAGVAVAGTLALFLLLTLVEARLERRLARMRAAFEGEGQPPEAGTPAAEASRARARIDAARGALESAARALAAENAR